MLISKCLLLGFTASVAISFAAVNQPIRQPLTKACPPIIIPIGGPYPPPVQCAKDGNGYCVSAPPCEMSGILDFNYGDCCYANPHTSKCVQYRSCQKCCDGTWTTVCIYVTEKGGESICQSDGLCS